MTPADEPVAPPARPVVLFDGVCNLCNGSVQFILKRDPQCRFRFASLQSEAGRSLMSEHGLRLDADPHRLSVTEGGTMVGREKRKDQPGIPDLTFHTKRDELPGRMVPSLAVSCEMFWRRLHL